MSYDRKVFPQRLVLLLRLPIITFTSQIKSILQGKLVKVIVYVTYGIPKAMFSFCRGMTSVIANAARANALASCC